VFANRIIIGIYTSLVHYAAAKQVCPRPRGIRAQRERARLGSISDRQIVAMYKYKYMGEGKATH
jgi:hypothetical protein